MLIPLASNLWHVQREFVAAGLRVSSRMTVVRLADGGLWLHSPIRINEALRDELLALGKVTAIVAPNKMHHLFLNSAITAFPQASVYGARGLSLKRPDLPQLQELTAHIPLAWQHDLTQIFVGGVPIGNETVWLHKPSRTLIMTDLCQWWRGDLPFMTKALARLTGVRKVLAVPLTIRLSIRDRDGLSQSAQAILGLDFDRLIVAHNAVIETGAHAEVARAFAFLIRH